jgi:hypothetical protein
MPPNGDVVARSSNRFRRRVVGVLAHAGLVAVSLSVAAGVGELTVRVVTPQQLILIRPDVWRPVDTLGWMFQPDLRTTINTGERTVRLFTDADGFRVGEAGRKPADARILLLGDSFMAALQVEYQESLAGLLEPRLGQRLGRPVTIRNAAQAGWDPSQYYLLARTVLRRDTFDLVVVALFVENDAIKVRSERIAPRLPVERHSLRLPRGLSWRELIDALFAPVNDYLETRSHLFVFLKTTLEEALMGVGLTAAYFPDEFRRSDSSSVRWAVTADVAQDIARLAAGTGTPAVFVLIPTSFQIDQTVFAKYVRGFGLDSSDVDLNQPSRLLRQALEARGLTVLDALPAFRAAHERGQRLYGTVDRHLSPTGHEVLARLCEPVVMSHLARPRGRSRPSSPVTAR